MNLTTIELDRSVALEKFREYRAAVRERHNDEDAQIMRGYRELAKGRQLIRLTETITAAGLDGNALPRLAVARADAIRVEAHRHRDGDELRFTFHSEIPGEHWTRWGCKSHAWRAGRCLGGFTHPLPADAANLHRRYSAIVPNVPPALRPAGSLRNYHILFEAEWDLTAPVDPALIRRVGGDLWAVLAVWDLTDLERAVLSGRANA